MKRERFKVAPAGHVDGGEFARGAMAREAGKEIGIALSLDALMFAHIMHWFSAEERIDFFFEARGWSGEAENKDPHKCDDLR